MITTDVDSMDADQLRQRLAEVEETLDALRTGAADAIFGKGGDIHHLPGSEKPYLAYFRAMGEGGVTLDSAGNILHGNPRFADMLGQPFSAWHGKSFLTFVAEPDRACIAALLRSEATAAAEVSLISATGSMPVRVSINPVEIGALRAACLVVTDLRERVQAEAELRIAAIAFESQDGIAVTDPTGRIIRVNRGFTQRTGYRPEEVVGRTHAVLHSGRQSRAFYEAMWQSLLQTGYWQGEMWNRGKDGKVYADWVTVSAVTAPDGRVTHYVGMFSEITKNKEALAEIHRLAYYDPLTGLPNRRLLQDRIRQALVSSSRSRHYGALLFLDLDHFKTLNDTRGHDIGDQLLVEVARRIRANIREMDTVARLGGDEFVVMLEELSAEAADAAVQAGHVGEKIREALCSPYPLPGRDHHGGASLGVTLFRDKTESVEALLKQADLALYKAKTSGRNALRFFDPTMQSAIEERGAMEADLRVAIDDGQLELHYQVQIGAQDEVVGAEALLRWRHPRSGLVAPGEFIPLAEETGLIVPIGLWVIEAACAQLRGWSKIAALRHVPISVNISARQLRCDDFVSQVRHALETSGIDPTRLKLELTESMVIDDFEATVEKMRALAAVGIRFSLDDFGTGSSSLSYLTRLPLDQIKIDRSFVVNLPDSPRDAVIADTIITMARSLRLDVVAEGVETEAQRDFLAERGCGTYQGFLFGRPQAPDEFERFVTRYVRSHRRRTQDSGLRALLDPAHHGQRCIEVRRATSRGGRV